MSGSAERRAPGWDIASLGEEQGLERGSYLVDAAGEPIARLLNDDHENLLAALPELVAALRQLTREGSYKTIKIARAALAAAKVQP